MVIILEAIFFVSTHLFETLTIYSSLHVSNPKNIILCVWAESCWPTWNRFERLNFPTTTDTQL